jgi:hypothetical protein
MCGCIPEDSLKTKKYIVAVAGVAAAMILVAAGRLAVEAREPDTRIELLPPRQWFTTGIVGDGPDSVTIQEIYGPISVTRAHPR